MKTSPSKLLSLLPPLLSLGLVACQKDEATKAAPSEAAQSQPATPAPEAASPEPATPSRADESLGSDRRDPPWFRKEFAEGWEVDKFSRSTADEHGRFSSQILFNLPKDMTPERCLEVMRERVSKTVPELETVEQGEGRILLRGKGDRYDFSGMCGKTEGGMKAYIGFAWVE